MKPTAKKLILGLLLAAEGRPLTVREAIDGCALFGITQNNVRVTLVRLSSEGLIESAGRGAYRLGPAARGLAGEVGHWQAAESRLRPWHGGYVAVFCAHLGRSDRGAFRRRERALHMLGLRELERDLFVRPDNLAGGVGELRQRLQALGMEAEACVCAVSELDAGRMARIGSLWPVQELNRGYQDGRQHLQDWLARCQELEPETAAREAYLLGAGAIRQLVFDPWLPEPMIDAVARHQFLETVRRFDATGKAIWHRLSASAAGMPLTAALSFNTGTLQ